METQAEQSTTLPTPADSTRERILSGALQLFTRRGIKSVSMDDIATSLGISKKTLYKWFETKDQLVLAVTNDQLGTAQNSCQRLFQTAENALHQIVLMMRWSKQEHADTHPGIFFELRKYFPAAYAAWQNHKLNFIVGQIEANLRQGIAEGLYRPEIDVEVLARLHVALIEGALDPDLFPARQFSMQRVLQAADEQLMRAIVNDRGRELLERYLTLL